MIARCNPFRSERIDNIEYRNPRLPCALIWKRLGELNDRGAIVGPDGSGKTTLLEELEHKLRAEGFLLHKIFMNHGSSNEVPKICRRAARATLKADFTLFDGADLLDEKEWRAFLKQTRGGLIITSHREGLLPTLVRCSTSLPLLEEIVEELTGSAGKFPLQKLYREKNGNIRDVLRALYDLCADEAHLSFGS